MWPMLASAAARILLPVCIPLLIRLFPLLYNTAVETMWLDAPVSRSAV